MPDLLLLAAAAAVMYYALTRSETRAPAPVHADGMPDTLNYPDADHPDPGGDTTIDQWDDRSPGVHVRRPRHCEGDL